MCYLSFEEIKAIVDSLPDSFNAFDFINRCKNKDNPECLRRVKCGKILAKYKEQLTIEKDGRSDNAQNWKKKANLDPLVSADLKVARHHCETYTQKLKVMYNIAAEKNKGLEDVYYCATPGYITARSLDYSKNNAFCEVGNMRKTKYEYNENRIQALLVKKAKQNSWMLPIEGKEWELLDAERNFANTSAPKKPDLIAYNKKDASYVVLELKENNKQTSIESAISELNKYLVLLDNEIECANHVYGKNVKKGNVHGFILMPQAPDVPRFGVVTFDNLNDLSDKTKFHIIKEPD